MLHSDSSSDIPTVLGSGAPVILQMLLVEKTPLITARVFFFFHHAHIDGEALVMRGIDMPMLPVCWKIYHGSRTFVRVTSPSCGRWKDIVRLDFTQGKGIPKY